MGLNSDLIKTVTQIAEKAGKIIVQKYWSDIENITVSRKQTADFVTVADKECEDIIFEELKKAYPGYSFVMEESGEVAGEDPDHIWIIDPIDGTKNFMNGIPHWAISIGLEVKGDIVAGVVYDPVKDEMFAAEKGQGAYLNGKKLSVSERSDLDSAVVSIGFPLLDPDRRKKFIDEVLKLLENIPHYRRTASAALDLAYVACGRHEGYFERNVKPWDMAAGYLLIKEAGGMVTNIDNDEHPVHSLQIMAGNPPIYNHLKKILRA